MQYCEKTLRFAVDGKINFSERIYCNEEYMAKDEGNIPNLLKNVLTPGSIMSVKFP